MLKVLQIIPTLGVGGAEMMMCNLSCELKKMACELVVITFYNKSSFIYKKIQDNNIKLINLDKKEGFNFKTLIQLRKIIRAEKPDVIHTHLYVLPYVFLVAGKAKIIHTLHTIASKEQEGIGKKLCGYIYKYSKRCVPVAISDNVKQSMDEEYNCDFKIPVIENGVDFNEILKKEDYNFNNEISIFHTGSLREVKNHRLMINSIKTLLEKHNNIMLHFFGNGELMSELEEEVNNKNLGNNIIFEGINQNISKDLKNGDIFILPSKYEGVPMSLLEAMAAGLPCVASDVGGIPNIVDNNINGILINANENDLVEALEKLIVDKDLREKIGKNAIIKAQEFSSTVMANKYIEVYRNDN